MNSFNDMLALIKVVNDNYSHISQLECLGTLLENENASVWLNEKEIGELVTICKTTHNSHYEYRLFTLPEYQNPDNHVDRRLEPTDKAVERYYEQIDTKGVGH